MELNSDVIFHEKLLRVFQGFSQYVMCAPSCFHLSTHKLLLSRPYVNEPANDILQVNIRSVH